MLTFLLFCKEDSYSETCAQRNAEGGGFPLSQGLHAGAAAGFLCFSFTILVRSKYSLGVRDKNENKIKNK
jgi:hypothetical protein